MPPSSQVATLQAQSGSPSRKNPRKHPNTKRTGELAEAAFVVKAAGLGFAVSKPWGDSERYDFILDAGHRTFRVQVKCTESPNANGYQVQSTYTDHKQKGHYTPHDIDVLVAYILPLDLWYVVPAQAFPASASLRFYPEGNISGRRPRFEQYREAWDLFHDRVGADASSAPERSEAGPIALHDCHLEQKRSEGEGPAVPGDCRAERSECEAERSTHGVEAPLPDQPSPPAPESPMERMMTQWAQRVNSLYNRKR